jgi:Uma2 family endonuclease
MAASSDSLHEQDCWIVPRGLRLQLLAALSTKPGQTARMTYEEFLAWADEDTVAEWVDGEVVMPSPASERHQDIQRFLLTLLASYAEFRQVGKVYGAPFQMKLEKSGREPDVLFVTQEHRSRVTPTCLNGPADLVVQIISPESVGRDRGDKFVEYEKAGIPEYWLIDPDTERAEFYQLDEKGAYQVVAPDTVGIYRSRVLAGFWLNVNWLWSEPMPRADIAMARIGGQEYLSQLTKETQDDSSAGDAGTG